MKRPTVLVADDDPGRLARLTDVLSEQDVDVIAARSGVEVLHHLNNNAPVAMAVVDVRVPPPGALRVVALARLAGFRGPFLLITAFPDDALRIWAAAMGGVSLLVEPFEAAQLLEAIQHLGSWRPPSGTPWPMRDR